LKIRACEQDSRLYYVSLFCTAEVCLSSVKRQPLFGECGPLGQSSNSHHMNLCTLPGSCGHEKPQYKNMYPVAALTTSSHAVSSHSLWSYSFHSAFGDGNDSFGLVGVVLFGGRRSGKCIRQKIQGRMKYLGSTKGAVMSCRAEVVSQMIANDTVAECWLSGRDNCSPPLISVRLNASAGPPPNVWMQAQAQRM